MELRTISPTTAEYEQMIALRIHSLLQPIGVPESYIEREKEKDDLFIGAFEGNEIVGCCVLTKRDEATIQLRQMAVRPDLRGKRIGAAIICFAEALARKNGYKTLMMHARDGVLDFYKKSGYCIAGEQFFEVGIGHHLMEKKL